MSPTELRHPPALPAAGGGLLAAVLPVVVGVRRLVADVAGVHAVVLVAEVGAVHRLKGAGPQEVVQLDAGPRVLTKPGGGAGERGPVVVELVALAGSARGEASGARLGTHRPLGAPLWAPVSAEEREDVDRVQRQPVGRHEDARALAVRAVDAPAAEQRPDVLAEVPDGVLREPAQRALLVLRHAGPLHLVGGHLLASGAQPPAPLSVVDVVYRGRHSEPGRRWRPRGGPSGVRVLVRLGEAVCVAPQSGARSQVGSGAAVALGIEARWLVRGRSGQAVLACEVPLVVVCIAGLPAAGLTSDANMANVRSSAVARHFLGAGAIWQSQRDVHELVILVTGPCVSTIKSRAGPWGDLATRSPAHISYYPAHCSNSSQTRPLCKPATRSRTRIKPSRDWISAAAISFFCGIAARRIRDVQQVGVSEGRRLGGGQEDDSVVARGDWGLEFRLLVWIGQEPSWGCPNHVTYGKDYNICMIYNMRSSIT